MTPKQVMDKTPIVAAIIGAIATIVVGYWQFVWKPSHSPPVQTTQYVGRVLDSDTEIPVSNAKVTLDFQGIPRVVYTDSEGVYRFWLPVKGDEVAIRVKVNADGYKVYDRNITLSLSIPQIEDIRLSHESANH